MVNKESARGREQVLDVTPQSGGENTSAHGGAGALVVDSQLLFSGTYSRDGTDLLISGEVGAAVRLPEYFSSSTSQALYSAEGAMLRGETVELLAGPRTPGQYAQADGIQGAEQAGKVGQITGAATVQHADGTSEPLAAEAPVFQGDVLRTGPDGTVGILFEDGTVLLLEPNSRIVINEYVYDPNSTSNSATLDAVDGTFAFVAGKVAKTGGLDVSTPIATMGIRGTTGLCVALDSAGARCSLAPDPNFDIGRIAILNNATGALFTTLTEIDVKLVLLPGGDLAVLDKTDREIVFDELLVQQLHTLYDALDVPQSGPLQKINFTGSPDFSVDVPGIGRFDGDPLPLLLDTRLDQPTRFEEGIVNTPLLGPIGGSSTIGNLEEADLGVGSTPLTGVLPFVFGEDQAVRFDFALLNGTAVLDSQGNAVTADGVPLRFLWDANTNILYGMAGSLVAFTVTLDPDSGRYSALLLAAIDHPVAGAADLLTIPLAFTITVEDGRSATGSLSIRFADDLPEIASTSAQTAENHTATGAWLLAPGADGVDSIVVTAGGQGQTLSLASPDNQVIFQLAQGTLIVKADGSWAFTASINLDNSAAQIVTFRLQATDGDGDAVATTSEVAITDGTPPAAAGGALTLVLDEKALDSGDVAPGDDVGSQPQLSTELATGVVSFSAGSDDLITFFLDASKVVVLDELGNIIAVTWVATATGGLIGRVNGADALSIEVGDAVIEAFTTGSVVVTAHLLDNFRHAADGSGTVQISGLAVIARDIDGSTTSSSAVNIAISDDSASIALGDTPAAVPEGGLVTGQWFLVPGADGVTTVTVSVVFAGQSKNLDLADPNNQVSLTTPQGVLTVFANGTWTFQAATNLDNEGPAADVTFTLSVRDGDDDTASVTDSQAIHVEDGTVAPVGHDFQPISVQETDPPSSSGTSTSSFNAGSDNLVSFAFDASTIVVKDEAGALLTVNWVGDGTGELVGRIDGADVIRLTLTADTIAALTTGNVTVNAALLSNFPHAFGGSGDVTITGIRIVGSEADGDAASAILSVIIGDDGPSIAFAPAPASVAEGDAAIGGLIAVAGGADKDATLDVTLSGAVLLTPITFALDGTQHIGSSVVETAAGDVLGVLTVTVEANGTANWAFKPALDVANNNSSPSFGLIMTVTDTDGDVASDSHTVAVTDGAGPSAEGVVALQLDEKDHADGTAAGGPDAGDPDTQQVAGGPVFTSGSDAIAGITFAEAQPTTGAGLDGTISWERSDDGLKLTGFIGQTAVIMLVLSGQLTAPAGGSSAAPTITATLLDAFPHDALPQDADTLTISGITLVATDSDGDFTTATISVQVQDDEPFVAIAQAPASVAEDAAPIGGAIALLGGADEDATLRITMQGAVLLSPISFVLDGTQHIQSSVVQTVGGDQLGLLTITVNADGIASWSFDPALDVANNGINPSFDFTVVVTDADGDIASDSHTVTVTDGAGPSADGNPTLSLTEQDTAAVGTANGITFTAGSDAITGITFAAADQQPTTGTGLDGQIVWTRSADGLTLTGSIDGTAVIELKLSGELTAAAGGDTATPTVTARLLDAFPHDAVPDADTLTISGITLLASDSDATTKTATLSVVVADDAPELSAMQDAILPNVEGATVYGTWVPDFGADGPAPTAAITISLGSDPSGIDYQSTALAGVTVDGSQVFSVAAVDTATGAILYNFYTVSTYDPLIQEAVLAAYTSAPVSTAGEYDFAPGSEYFLLTMEADGSYLFELVNNDFFARAVADASDADPGNYNPALYVVGTSFYDAATLPGGVTPDVVISGTDDHGVASVISVSQGAGGGLSPENNNFENDETVKFVFNNAQTDIELDISKLQNGESATFQILINGQPQTLSVTSDAPTLTLLAADFGLASFTTVEITKIANAFPPAGYGDDDQVTIGQITYNSRTLIGDAEFNFQVALTDGDGDVLVSSDELNVRLEGDTTGGGYTLTGSDQSPETIASSDGSDTILGGTSANDTADYSNADGPVNADLAAGTAIVGATADSLSGIENLIGSDHNDVLIGNALDNVLNGGNGDDTLDGGAGLNTMTGGLGHDIFVIDAGALAELGLVDVIADYAEGVDLIDLSSVFTSVGVNSADEAAAALNITFEDGAAHILVDDNGSAAGGTMQEVASLTGVGPDTVISILYDHDEPPMAV